MRLFALDETRLNTLEKKKKTKYWMLQGKGIACSFQVWQYKTLGYLVKLKAIYLQLLERFFLQDTLKSIHHGFRAIFKDYLLYMSYMGATKLNKVINRLTNEGYGRSILQWVMGQTLSDLTQKW